MICVVIPTLNSEHQLTQLLSGIDSDASRLVVTDGGSTDGTLREAARAGARIALGSAGRGNQLKRGCRWGGECDWLLCLHADSRLPDRWLSLVTHHIERFPDKAGYFDLRFDASGWQARCVEGLVRLRCRALGLPYGDQGLLISRRLYDACGGYPDMHLFEDVALVRALGRRRILPLGGVIVTGAEKYERDGYFRRGWRNLRLLSRYLRGESVETLLKAYT